MRRRQESPKLAGGGGKTAAIESQNAVLAGADRKTRQPRAKPTRRWEKREIYPLEITDAIK